MIYDSLSEAANYAALNPLFEAAFSFIETMPSSIADGRYPIVGDHCYAIVYQSNLKKVDDAKLEVHDRYIDIQTVIDGVEKFGIRPRPLCNRPIGTIDNEKDILFFDDQPTNFIDVVAGQFALFMPQDAHAPLIGEGTVRKVVVKVRV